MIQIEFHIISDCHLFIHLYKVLFAWRNCLFEFLKKDVMQ